MFTHVPGHGNTPQWLPPSMSVHHGDWKLIRTFHYGEDGNHEYRFYNLREDIGESKNLAAVHPGEGQRAGQADRGLHRRSRRRRTTAQLKLRFDQV